jgi:hypothetical protein
LDSPELLTLSPLRIIECVDSLAPDLAGLKSPAVALDNAALAQMGA